MSYSISRLAVRFPEERIVKGLVIGQIHAVYVRIEDLLSGEVLGMIHGCLCFGMKSVKLKFFGIKSMEVLDICCLGLEKR